MEAEARFVFLVFLIILMILETHKLISVVRRRSDLPLLPVDSSTPIYCRISSPSNLWGYSLAFSTSALIVNLNLIKLKSQSNLSEAE